MDHYLRRTDAQERVIGTLLGTRSDGGAIVDVRTAFAVLHSETDEMVAVDKEYHRTMFDLCHKVNSREVIVGWQVLETSYLFDSTDLLASGIRQAQTLTRTLPLYKTSIHKRRHPILLFTSH